MLAGKMLVLMEFFKAFQFNVSGNPWFRTHWDQLRAFSLLGFGVAWFTAWVRVGVGICFFPETAQAVV